MNRLMSAMMLCCVSTVANANFAGSSSGVFTATTPVCDDVVICSGVATDTLTFGEPLAGSAASTLRFVGTRIDAASSAAVSVGNLFFSNGSLNIGSEIERFNLTLNFTADPGTTAVDPLSFGFRVINTPNVGTDEQNADAITLLTINDFTILETQNFLAGSGIVANSFNVLEGASTAVQILVHFSAPLFAGFGAVADPQLGFLSHVTVPEPDMIGWFVFGLAGLLLLSCRHNGGRLFF